MTLPASLSSRLSLPIIASPMFIISQLDLVMAQCRAGIVGSFPSLNARGEGELEGWLERLNAELTADDAPYAVNLIVHHSNARLEEDLALCVKHRVPIVISSLGAREEVNAAIHSYGGIVFHDVINDHFARKAIAKGADGLIAVAAGAGGHAGTTSPFALIGEIRQWFDGPVALSGSIATGDAVLAAQAMGADLAYIGSAFIATEEAVAVQEYKQMIVDSHAADIVYSNLFTGVHGNYLRGSIAKAGMDPDDLPESDPSKMDFGASKAWKDIWGSGQGIGAVDAVVPAAKRIAQIGAQFRAAKKRICSDS
ncbi:NAD(P)H-dependent flavin oxidoreductase [Croceicoccus naphthovorans]|uniref:2-nitropropane dioxygenase n=1 Tax=Croceicoccus naphthovorans TaxID=1348774 RepID=A0A0G3XIJ4_9SPHN|nr:nitronate monooxygenase family protein [Croceicoccus naphthovorans]AKM10429.1 2-nitropropane dioxygenase [Croceicoccus naphthovorans]MBB3990139.1 nitronate monooxygenase [Croceicoccus naphthovorans]